MSRLAKCAVASLAVLMSGQGLSQHLWYNDPGQDGDLLISRIMVDHTVGSTYYEVLGWNQGGLAGGYTGIQDNGNGQRSFIFSIWDPSATEMINSARYVKPGGTTGQRFGGEGTGYQIFNRGKAGPVWQVGQWYTIATRLWDVGNHTMAAAWLYDETAQKWSLEGIHDVPANFRFQYGAMAFLENYGGVSPELWRRMYTAGGYKRYGAGLWRSFTEGDYDGPATNANGGTSNGAFYMETGSNVTNTVGTNAHFTVPPFGSQPVIPTGAVTSASAFYDQKTGNMQIRWSLDEKKAPQYGYELQLSASSDFSAPISASDTAPEARMLNVGAGSFAAGPIYGRVRIIDLLDRTSAWQNFVAVKNTHGSSAYVSDLSWTSSSNGYGPIERDRSNGEAGAGDGHTLRLNGMAYAKGIGCHANSQVIVPLNKAYRWFISDIGIDDEMPGTNGSAIFRVYLDGVLAYDSSILNGSTTTPSIAVNVTGVTELKLVTTDAGDGNGQDHTDWADARLIASTSLASLSISPSSLPGGGPNATGRVAVDISANAGGTVQLSSTGPEVVVPASVTVPSGQVSVSFAVKTTSVAAAVTRTVVANHAPDTLSTTVTVLPYQLASFTIAPSGVVAGNSATGTVTLNGVAPAGGIVVNLSDNSAALVTPASVTVPAGQSSATFTVETTVTSVEIMRQVTAKLGGSQMTRNLIILLPDITVITASPTTLKGGTNSVGTIYANGKAGNGFVVNLTSSGPQLIVPPSATFSYGQSSHTFTIQTQPVLSTYVRYITATRNGRTRTVTLTITK